MNHGRTICLYVNSQLELQIYIESLFQSKYSSRYWVTFKGICVISVQPFHVFHHR